VTEFNPDTPATRGLQWFPRFKASQPVSSANNSAAARFTCPEDYDPEFISLYFDSVSQFEEGQGSGWEVEIYDEANLGTTNTTFNIHTPGEDIRAKGPLFGYSALETPQTFSTNLWRAIDSGSLTRAIWPNTGNPIDNNELLFPILEPGIDNNGYEYAARFSGITGAYTNERITRVSIMAHCQEYVDISFVAGMGITPFFYMNGVRYLGPSQTFKGETQGGHTVRADWAYNPETRVSWKVPDVSRFANGVSALLDAYSAGWIVDPTGSANNLATILRGWLEIEFTQEPGGDPRLGYGRIRTPVHGWNIVPLHGMLDDPETTRGGFTLQAGHSYIITVRQRSGRGRLSARYLDPGVLDDVDPEDIDTPIVAWTANSYVLDSVVDTQTRRFPWSFHTSAPTTSLPIGQPYVSSGGDYEPDLRVNTDWTPVNVDATIYQVLSANLGDSFRWLRVLARAEDGLPDDDLVMTLADNTGTPLATVTFTPDDLDDPVDGWQILEGALTSTITGHAAYRVVASSGATAGSGWKVQVLSTQDPDSNYGAESFQLELTYGGTAEFVHTLGADHTFLDMCATIASVPAAPAALAAVADADDCKPFVTLTWTPTSLSASFRRYEVERMDERTAWHRIGNITDEAVGTLTTRENRPNVASSYRIRVRRQDWSASLWSATVTATPVMTCCGYMLTSDVRPDLTGWYDDVGATRTTQFPEDVTYLKFQGRNYSVGFHPLEYDGATFTRTLALAMKDGLEGTPETSTPGERTYDPILAWRASKDAGVPYVCVVNKDGDRWFASFVTNDFTREEPSGRYKVEVVFTEVTDVPYPVDATS
jgi:hypothetical protein